MLHLLKKLKLYTKLGPERVHQAPINIQIKMYLWSFADYQHSLQKYFYNWNIILTYCFIYKINIRGNFIWKCSWLGHILEILGGVRHWPERTLFWKKGTKNFTPLPPLPPIQSLFKFFCIKTKLCITFTKGGSVRYSDTIWVWHLPCW